MPLRISSEDTKQKKPARVSRENRPIVAAGIAIAAVFLLFIIGMGILVVSFIGRFAEDDSPQISTVSYSIKSRTMLDQYTGRTIGNAYELYGEEGAADMEGETTLPNITSEYGTGAEFEYGTIKGNTYKSKFSGITFDAPSGWTLKGASKGTVTPTSVLDLDARNSSGSMSVKLQYFSLSGGNYTSTKQVMNALKAQVGNDVEMQTKIRVVSGLNFAGFAFDGMNGQEVARSQVMVTEVKGYALVLQVVAPTQKDIDNILKNFS